MIEILTGVPGSGKSYFAVYHILKLLDEGHTVVHNIHGLSDPRALLVDFGQMPLSADVLFPYFDQLRSSRNLDPQAIIHVYIDEAQRYYPYEYKDPKGVYFFDFHRHHGLNITLISQDIKKLSPKITTLAEYEVRAVKPMFQFTPGFSYNLLSSGEAFGKKRLPKKPEVFASYTSFTAGTKKTKKSKLIFIVPIFVVVAILAYVAMQYSFANSFDKLSEQHNQAKKEKDSKTDVIPPKGVIAGNITSGNELASQNKTDYVGPVVLDYSSGRDAVMINESGLDVWIPVKDFVLRFHPQIYGYGYLHFPGKRFIQMNASNNEYIFPVKNPIYVANYIKNTRPVAQVSPGGNETITYPLEFQNKTNRPDKDGYTRSDYEMIYRRQRGLPDPPAVSADTAAALPSNSTSAL